MLYSREGFIIFNGYDLEQILQVKNKKLQKEIEAEGISDIEDEDSYIESKIKEYSISPLVFYPNRLTVKVKELPIPSNYFPSTYWVDEGHSYNKPVLTYYLPFDGNPDLFGGKPSTRILRSEKVFIEGNNLGFEIINFNNDVTEINSQKDDVINFIINQSKHVNDEVNRYNEGLRQFVKESIERVRDKNKASADLLSQLGTPVRTETIPAMKSEKIRPNGDATAAYSYDVFVSHASEDKDFVEQLVGKLQGAGIKVWYDGHVLDWGDDLRSTIDSGLSRSRYSIVVFSKSFLGRKRWTEHELNGLFALERNGEKKILPIWHNISQEDLVAYSPAFADRLAKRSDQDSTEDIVQSLVKLLER